MRPSSLPRLTPTALIVALTLAGGCALDESPEREESGPIVPYIVGGTKSSAFAATGALVYQGKHICTATLISSDKALSAAHCFVDAPAGAVQQAEFVLGATSSTSKTRSRIKKVLSHPQFRGINSMPAPYDIALVLLATPITSVMPVVLHSQDPTPLIGQSMMLVGYGQSDASSQPGVRREVNVTLAKVAEYNVGYEFKGTGACYGDSGGPAFMKFGDEWRQVGITSGGEAEDRNCRVNGWYQRVDVHFKFLTDQGVSLGDRPRQCIEDKTCDGLCYEDKDCASLLPRQSGGTTPEPTPTPEPEPTPTPTPQQPQDPCVRDGICVQSCGTSDPDCPQASAPSCRYVTRSFSNMTCLYLDYFTGQICFSYPATCYSFGCYCPF